MWRGTDIGLMFGCASLPGTDLDANAAQLSYLAQHHMAPPELRPRALEGLYHPMERLAPGTYDAKRAMLELPPLVKGYLRLGGFVGDGAVIDPQFNTTGRVHPGQDRPRHPQVLLALRARPVLTAAAPVQASPSSFSTVSVAAVSAARKRSNSAPGERHRPSRACSAARATQAGRAAP
jgi:hypothetical protein